MQERWKTALIGGGIGAVLSLAVVAGAIGFNAVPLATDARLQNYLLTHPKLAYEMQAMAEVQDAEQAQKDSQAAVDKIGIKRFLDPAVAYVTGPASAKNTVVELYDYNCVHCRNTSTALKKFMDAHKTDVRFAFIEFPVFGEASNTAARISIAARQQGDKFLKLHFGLMSEGRNAIDAENLSENAHMAGLDVQKLNADLNKPEVEKAVLAGQRLAREGKFRGTPVFIVNGKVHEGELTEAEMKDLIR